MSILVRVMVYDETENATDASASFGIMLKPPTQLPCRSVRRSKQLGHRTSESKAAIALGTEIVTDLPADRGHMLEESVETCCSL